MDILKTLRLGELNYGTGSGSNSWCKTTSNGLIESINPTNKNLIAKVYTCSQQDYESVLQTSIAAQKKWREVPAPQRGELVRNIGNALREHKDALGSLVSMEMGKIKQEGDGEVQEMIDMADFAVGQSRMLYGKTMHSERTHHRMYEQWHPLGVVGVITAFNFPVAVWAWNAFIAVIAGNSVIWKPSSKVPLCALAIQHICNQVTRQMGYDGMFSIFSPGDKGIAEHFVNDSRVNLISFTGSSAVGHAVAETVAKRMGRCLLECSGNNAIIVDKTADLDLAVPAIVFGAVGTAGQRCTTTRRLLIHESIYAELVNRLLHAYRQITVGDPLDPQVLMGPLIDQRAMDDYSAAVTSIRNQGGEILIGGETVKREGYFVSPTLVAVPRQSGVVKEETFAPILYLIKYQNLDEAIEIQNGVPQGLSSAIFTNTLQNAEQFLASTGSDCGIANVNIGTSGAEIGGAFGGEKETGGGREAGSDAWKAYMRRQTTTINWGSDLPLAQGIEFKLDS